MKWLSIFAAIIGLYACHLGLDYPTGRHRFRLTVNVETPFGTRSGSSVMEAVVNRQPGWFALRSGMVSHASLVGEAIFVDLGPASEGRPSNLIALLAWGPRGTDSDFADIQRQAYFDYLGIRHQKYPGEPPKRTPPLKVKLSPHECENGGDTWCIIEKYPVGTKMEIRGDLIPTLITIRNLNDPRSALVVEQNSLHGVFGDGFSLGDVTLEIVKPSSWPLSMFGMGGEPLAHMIEAKMPAIFRAFRAGSAATHIERIGDPFILRPQQLKQTI